MATKKEWKKHAKRWEKAWREQSSVHAATVRELYVKHGRALEAEQEADEARAEATRLHDLMLFFHDLYLDEFADSNYQFEKRCQLMEEADELRAYATEAYERGLDDADNWGYAFSAGTMNAVHMVRSTLVDLEDAS